MPANPDEVDAIKRGATITGLERGRRDAFDRGRRRTMRDTVLFVDDESALLNIWAGWCHDLGLRCYTALDGHQALEAYDEIGDRIAAVVTDLNMPGMSGEELARQWPETHERPWFILVTGSAGLVESSSLFDYILSKPLDTGTREWLLNELLDRTSGGRGS